MNETYNILNTTFKDILESAINKPISSLESVPISGGSINQTLQIIINKKDKYFCKINSAEKFPQLFEKEKNGLELLRSKNVFIIPTIILHTIIDKYQFLIMEWIEPSLPVDSFWEVFGEQLAELHSITHDQFGLAENNYMGALPQSNHFENSWVDFFIRHRLQPQLELAINKQLIDYNQLSLFEELYKKLPDIFSEEPPALLHGDLWNGNFICSQMQKPVIIDPAVYFGHRAIDLGMTTLFGGFENKFYSVYSYHSYLAANYKTQWEVCNLYPVLIHLNLFGGSYHSQVMTIVKKYC